MAFIVTYWQRTRDSEQERRERLHTWILCYTQVLQVEPVGPIKRKRYMIQSNMIRCSRNFGEGSRVHYLGYIWLGATNKIRFKSNTCTLRAVVLKVQYSSFRWTRDTREDILCFIFCRSGARGHWSWAARDTYRSRKLDRNEWNGSRRKMQGAWGTQAMQGCVRPMEAK